MKTKSLFAITFLFLVLIGTPSWAMTYYVDFAGGNDTNAGTSTAAAWKHCPGDNQSGGKAASAVLKAADMVIFKGGVSYIGKITVSWSGSAGNPIIYDGNTSGTWGTGKAILDGGDTHVYASRAFTIISQQNITVKGFIIQNYSGLSCAGIRMESSGFISIQDCKVWDIGDWALADPQCHDGGCDNSYLNGGAGGGVGIAEYKCSDILIENTEVTKTTTIGISLKGIGKNLEVRDCYVHDFMIFGIDIDPADAGSLLENVFVHNNRIANFYSYTGSYWTSTIDGKVNAGDGNGALPHMDGLFFRNAGHGTYKNAQIYNNHFFNDMNFPSNESGQNTMFYISQMGRVNGVDDEVYVYNNLFQGSYFGTVFRITSVDYGKIYVFNNTFYMRRSSAISFTCLTVTDGTKLYIKNNIFLMKPELNEGAAINIYNDTNARYNIISDNNLYVVDGAKGVVTTEKPWKLYVTLADWQKSGYGQDQHSIQAASAALVDPKEMFYSSSSDLRLRLDSPAINKGIDLGQDFPFLKYDKDGNLRGVDGHWDIGAYEYIPQAAQNLSLTAGWNWISFNVLPTNISQNSVFSGILDKIEQVKTQTQSAIRSNGIWKGDLADMNGIGQYKMYKVKVSQACTLTVTGTTIASATPIQLAGGWNWVAYLPTTSMPITTALASINGQVQEVKSLTQSATWNGTSWSGNLTQLNPGQGYAIKMNAPGTLTYPAVASTQLKQERKKK
jgi:hypothetical protein